MESISLLDDARDWRNQSWSFLGIVTIALTILGGLLALDAGDQSVIGLVIVFIACGLAFLSPGAGLGAVVLATPTAFELHPLPGGAYSLLEVAILVAAAGIGLRLLVQGPAVWWYSLKAIASQFQITVTAFLLIPVAVIALITMPDLGHRAEAIREIRLVIVEPLIAFASMLIVFRHDSLRRWAWTCAASIGLVVATFAVGEFLLGRGVDAGSVTRATAIYTHPNNLALFLERTLLLTLPWLLIRFRSPWPWIVVGIQAAGLIVTFSRGGYVAVVIGAAVALLLLGMRKQLAWLAIASLIAAVGLLAVARDRILDIGGDGAEPTRFAIWRSSLRMLADHPIWGVGPDQFLYQYGRRYIEPAAWPERYTSHPHNVILDSWLRLGMLGVVVLGAVAIFIIQWIVAMKRAISRNMVAVGAAAALAGGFAHGMLDNGFFIPDLAVLTWLCVAYLVTVTVESEP